MRKIDIDKQLSELYSTLDFKSISANAISIYVCLLQIARKTGWADEFRVSNTTLMSKIKGLSVSSLQRARNELINFQLIKYKKGTNQNESPIYSIPILESKSQNKILNEQANEQADEQANEQADEQASEQANEQADKQADEYIITKLNLFYKYINKGENRKRNSDFQKKIDQH